MKTIYILLALFICNPGFSATPPGDLTTIYVNDDAVGTNSGDTWFHAFTDLQDALDLATPGDTILVQEGTYFPSLPSNDNPGCMQNICKTFTIPDSVILIGGWSSAQTYDPSKFRTILSGDLGILMDSTDNAGTIVTFQALSSSVIFQGFHIQHSLWSALTQTATPNLKIKECYFIDNYNTAAFILNSQAYVENCHFIENHASVVAALGFHKTDSSIYSATVKNCTFRKNTAINAVGALSALNYDYIDIIKCSFDSNSCGLSGGAIKIQNATTALIDSSTFTSNLARDGGAISCSSEEIEISNCQFIGNLVSESGGALKISTNSDSKITACQFLENHAEEEGGAIHQGTGSLKMERCTLENNSTLTDGGGLYLWRSDFNISRSLFQLNKCSMSGGGFYSHDSDGRLYSSCFYRDSANIHGGAIAMYISDIEIINNTIVENYADSSASIYCTPNNWTFLDIYNSILWGDSNQIEPNGQQVSISHSDIQGGYPGTGNLDTMPDFSMGGRPWDVHFTSPTINAGNNSYLGINDTTDFYGFNRIDLQIVDMGCGESPIEAMRMSGGAGIYVDSSNTTGSQTGDSWATAFSDLQDAIAVAGIADTIFIAKGSYFPSEYPRNCSNCDTTKDLTFHLKDSMTIIGGYPSGGGIRNTKLHRSYLDGNIGDPNDSTDNVNHVILIIGFLNKVVLDGITVQNGNALLTGSGSINIDGQVVPRNTGGGIFSTGTRLFAKNVNVQTNNASTGGGIRFYGYTGREGFFDQCNFIGNQCITSGGGLIATNTDKLTFTKCTFNENASLQNGIGSGAGLYTWLTDTILINNSLFYNNLASNNGSSASFTQADVIHIENTTIDKYEGDDANQLYIPSGIVNVHNSILPTDSTAIDTINSASISVMYSIIDSFWVGPGNMNQDPLWTNPAQGDYRLSYISPARNSGDNGLVNTSMDIQCYPRIAQGTVDIGAFEYYLPCEANNTRVYVDATATGNEDGTCWEHAYNELFSAISAADNGDTILIAEADYFPKPSLADPRSATFTISKKITLLGGYPEGGSYDHDRNTTDYRAVLSGDIGAPRDYHDNLYKVVTVDGPGELTTRMIGIAIKYGNANAMGHLSGGAMHLNDIVHLDDVLIERNLSNKNGPITFTSADAYLILNECTLRLNSPSDKFSNLLGAQVEINEGTRIE